VSISLLEKPASALTDGDLQRLLQDAVPESLTLDYKRQIALDQKSDRKEFATDVSAFANKSGGYILIGIDEAGGAPTAINGVNVVDLDALKLQIENVLGALVAPKIVGIEVAGVPLASGNQVVAVRIPASLAAPHASDGRFFGRSAAGKYPMDVIELGGIFRSSAGFVDRALEFHRARRELVERQKWAVELDSAPKFLIHMLPRRAFDLDAMLDVAKAESEWPSWLLERRASGANYRFNFDGLAVYGINSNDEAIEGALLYRSGIYEALISGGFWQEDSGELRLATLRFEDAVVDKLPPMLAKLATFGSAPPFVCIVSAVGALGTRIVRGHSLSPEPVDRPTLELPLLQIISVDDDLRMLAKPMFNALWQAGGYAASPSYGAKGEWRRTAA
jgi:hypothetical protein